MGRSTLNLQCSGISNKTNISEELKIAEFFPTDAWHIICLYVEIWLITGVEFLLQLQMICKKDHTTELGWYGKTSILCLEAWLKIRAWVSDPGLRIGLAGSVLFPAVLWSHSYLPPIRVCLTSHIFLTPQVWFLCLDFWMGNIHREQHFKT